MEDQSTCALEDTATAHSTHGEIGVLGHVIVPKASRLVPDQR